MRARLAWALALVSLVVFVADTLVTPAAYGALWSEKSMAVHGWPFVNIATLGASLMGALIVSRYPRQPIGLLLCGVGVTGQLAMLAESYGVWVIHEHGPGPQWFGHLSSWLSALIGAPVALSGLAIMFLVAPDGTLLSRRWRFAALVSIMGFACFTLAMFSVSPFTYEVAPEPEADSVQPNAVAAVLFVVGILLLGIGLILAGVSMALRLRRVRGAERQQLRWIALAAVMLATGFATYLVLQAVTGEQSWLAAMPLFVPYMLLPVFIAIAVLHHRLYDIDVIINRALVLALGTAFAAIGYVGLVVLVGHQVGSQTGGFWPSLLASALVALAFQPVRRRVVRVADRIAFGERAAPYEELAEFSRRLGESPDPQLILPAVAESAGRAVSARRATVMLRLPGADVESATWPADAPGEGVDYEVPVGIGPETFGSILVSVAPGRSLRSGEQRLLGDLADQAALAFRNSAMDAELTQHLADLDRRTQALAESRRRIVEARDRERSRLEASISHEVVAHLVGLPSALEHVHNGQGGDLPGQVEHWLAETTEALESLRGLTRAVFPTQLARAGLAAAMTSYLAQNGITGRLTIEDSMRDRRFDFRAETAAYFCFVEAMGDVDGHTRGAITLEGRDLVLRMRDPATPTMDLQAMTDRVEAVDGSLSIGTDGAGMTLTVRLPAEPAAVTGA